MSLVSQKTAVNARASLASRLPKRREEAPAPSYALHRTVETTYDDAYTAPPAHASSPARGGQAAAQGGRNADGARVAAKADGSGRGQGVGGQTYVLDHHPSSAWESTSHAAAENIQVVRPHDFYASARKIEREDDDRRGGLVGRLQRTLDIRTKRAEDASLRPPSPTYEPMEVRQMPPALAQERYGATSNYLDLVECTQLKPNTEEQISYDVAPLARLPDKSLSQELRVQSKAITHMSTSNELFRGTPKYLPDTAVSYVGHVPMAPCNVARINHGEDARRRFAKATMTMAEHGSGVDVAVIGANLAARHRGGKKARAPPPLQPKTAECINQTVEGRMLRQTFKGTLERERSMNLRDDAQGKNFF